MCVRSVIAADMRGRLLLQRALTECLNRCDRIGGGRRIGTSAEGAINRSADVTISVCESVLKPNIACTLMGWNANGAPKSGAPQQLA